MKTWKKAVSIAVVVLIAWTAAILLFGSKKSCALCTSPSFPAPCLIDLVTGDILDLNLDGPTTSYSTSSPSYAETISFIRFGSVSGIKETAPNVIELKIPLEDKVKSPALCSNCRKLLQQGYEGRYVLADTDNKKLFPISANTKFTICGYMIVMIPGEEKITLTIR